MSNVDALIREGLTHSPDLCDEIHADCTGATVEMVSRHRRALDGNGSIPVMSHLIEMDGVSRSRPVEHPHQSLRLTLPRPRRSPVKAR